MEALDLKEQIQRKYVDKEQSEPTQQVENKSDEKEKLQQTEDGKKETQSEDVQSQKKEIKETSTEEQSEVKAEQPKEAELPKAEEKIIDPALSSLKSKTEENQNEPQIDEDLLNRRVEEKIKEGYISKKTGNEFIDWMLEQHEKGVNITKDWVHNKTKSYENYDISNPNDALKVVKENLMAQGFTAEEADWKANKKYSALTSGEFEEGDPEYKDAQMALRIDARAAKTNLQKSIEELAAPDGGLAQKGITEDELNQRVNQTINTHFDTISKDMSEYYNKNLSDYQKEVFSIGDSQIEFEVTPEMNKQVGEDFANYFSALDRLSVNKEGKTDAAKLRQNLLKLRYFDDIVSAAAKQSAEQSKKQFVEKEIKNTDKDTTATKQTPNSGQKPKIENYTNRSEFLKAQIEWQTKNKN